MLKLTKRDKFVCIALTYNLYAVCSIFFFIAPKTRLKIKFDNNFFKFAYKIMKSKKVKDDCGL